MAGPLEARTLSLRKDEVESIVEVLEQDHETVQDAARAVLKGVLRLWQGRDWYVITSKEFGLSYGVYGTENEAIAKAEKGHDLGIGGELFITKIHSTLGQEAAVSAMDKAAIKVDRPCSKCNHLQSEHEGTGRCVAPARTIRTKSGSGPAKPCKCRRYSGGST